MVLYIKNATQLIIYFYIGFCVCSISKNDIKIFYSTILNHISIYYIVSSSKIKKEVENEIKCSLK